MHQCSHQRDHDEECYHGGSKAGLYCLIAGVAAYRYLPNRAADCNHAGYRMHKAVITGLQYLSRHQHFHRNTRQDFEQVCLRFKRSQRKLLQCSTQQSAEGNKVSHAARQQHCVMEQIATFDKLAEAGQSSHQGVKI